MGLKPICCTIQEVSNLLCIITLHFQRTDCNLFNSPKQPNDKWSFSVQIVCFPTSSNHEADYERLVGDACYQIPTERSNVHEIQFHAGKFESDVIDFLGPRCYPTSRTFNHHAAKLHRQRLIVFRACKSFQLLQIALSTKNNLFFRGRNKWSKMCSLKGGLSLVMETNLSDQQDAPNFILPQIKDDCFVSFLVHFFKRQNIDKSFQNVCTDI